MRTLSQKMMGIQMGIACIAVFAMDADLVGMLNNDAGIGLRRTSLDADQAFSRMRSGFEQDLRSIGAAIAIKTLQSTDPGQDSDLNAAMRTPGGVDQLGAIIPSTANVTK